MSFVHATPCNKRVREGHHLAVIVLSQDFQPVFHKTSTILTTNKVSDEINKLMNIQRVAFVVLLNITERHNCAMNSVVNCE